MSGVLTSWTTTCRDNLCLRTRSSELPPPIFTSFDDAWRWFSDGGELMTLEEQRARFTEGRAQFLSFQVRVTEPAAIDLALDVQDAVAGIEGVEPFPDDLLHVSVLGVGFQ